MIEAKLSFSESRIKFTNKFQGCTEIPRSLCPVDGKYLEGISIVDSKGVPNEEFYKWEFIYSLIDSDLIPRDYIGVEVYFPKGNIGSTPIKIDCVVFDRLDWIDDYNLYRQNKDADALGRLRKSAVFLIEFKRDGDIKRIEQVFNSQIKATIKESDKEKALGAYYDKGRLYLFKKVGGEILRLDSAKNQPSSQRILERFQLEITDPYFLIPSLDQLKKLDLKTSESEISKKKVDDLDVIFSMNDEGIRASLSSILKSLDSVSLFSEEGYHILIQMLALKIYDEKQSEQHGSNLDFYISDEEKSFSNLNDGSVADFVKRMSDIFSRAKKYYKNILGESRVNWKNVRHVRVACEIAYNFQRYSFVRSRKSDLYQLVFYNFATKFKKEENAQFLTPIPIIDFLVKMVNPSRKESVCDPCCGIGDFLSVSFVNSQGKLDDCNLYGYDNDYNMTVLAQLNMLLNGDGNAVIKYVPERGSITHKLSDAGEVVRLNAETHASGNWNNWSDETELMKYDVVLTNPPFGKGRSLDLSSTGDLEAAKLYETYDLFIEEGPRAGLDLGVVFLENAVKSLRENGRFGIVLSNSIASNKSFEFARRWLLENARVVAIIDLPANIFAETGVNTTIIIGYRPSISRLNALKEDNYSVFCRDIESVGYKKRTSNRNVFFEPDYTLNDVTFETVTDENGISITNEDFSKVLREFKEWCIFQEHEVKTGFLG